MFQNYQEFGGNWEEEGIHKFRGKFEQIPFTEEANEERN